MKLLHMSTRANRDSILKNGIIPSYIKLENHFDIFKDYGLKERKCVYTWDPNRGQSTDKYVNDMIYCKLFIHPRNDMAQAREDHMNRLWDKGLMDSEWEDDSNLIDFSKLGSTLYGKSDVYDLYEIDIDEQDPLLLDGNWIHCQTSDESDKYGSCHMMDDNYAHEDKILHIGKDIIPPSKFKIVNSIKSRVYNNNTIGISYSNNL